MRRYRTLHRYPSRVDGGGTPPTQSDALRRTDPADLGGYFSFLSSIGSTYQASPVVSQNAWLASPFFDMIETG